MDCEGRSGGLPMWWKGGVDVYLQSFSKGHIDVWVNKGLEKSRGGMFHYRFLWTPKSGGENDILATAKTD